MSITVPKVAVLGGGCFWCTEAIFERVKGVQKVEPGYAGGFTPDPVYEDVCSGRTGHAEVVRIVFDPDVIGYEELLEIFLHTHDPTTPDRQGADRGTQYRSIILTTNSLQHRIATEVLRKNDAAGVVSAPIVTQIAPLETFYPAENYHRDYYENNSNAPYCTAVIAPKLEKFRKLFDHAKVTPRTTIMNVSEPDSI
ncbi:MAG: peptide-methionine (S)-S-oxide reductase MsrA [Patescibacteria group bacterium]|nr:peptide-methionine (S)-S-oxide reductase MsrA [Patescibacteria group bacterium]